MRGDVIQLDPSVFHQIASIENTEGKIGKKMTAKQRKLLADYGRIKRLSAGNSAINITDSDFSSLKETLDYLSTHGFIRPVDITGGFGRLYIKENAFEFFMEQLLSQEQAEEEEPVKQPYSNHKVFVVHGHNDALLNEVQLLLINIGLTPIVLKNEANAGRTIIEKIEDSTDVGFGIVLYTSCDVGRAKGEADLRNRARQNVVFEHGYLCAKLERKRVAALNEADIEVPSDLSGVLYISLSNSDWKSKLMKEMHVAGLVFNPMNA